MGQIPDTATAAPAPVLIRVGDGVIEVVFPYSQQDVHAIRKIPGRRWHEDRKVWTVPDQPGTRAALRREFVGRLRLTTGTPATAEEVVAELTRIFRAREYSPKTERAYIGWTRRFLRWSAGRGSGVDRLDSGHASDYLDHLATRRRLAPKSRNQAASALAFMFREVLGRDAMADIPRARGPKRVPVVLAHREVIRVLRALTGKHHLIGVLLYSAGLRLEECLRLRVKDIDFELRQIIVRDGKGRKDRYVPLAMRAVDLLHAQVSRVAQRHVADRDAGHGWAPLPGALHRKDPDAGYQLHWQYLFPATTITTDPATGRTGRHPLHATAVQRAVKAAVGRAGITKRATCHTLRHSFATETLRGGCDIRTLQHVLGHKDIRTTMIYLHVVEQTGVYIRSPLDRPDDDDDLTGLDVRPDFAPPSSARMSRQWDIAQQEQAQRRPERPRTDRPRPRDRN